jgi:basic amino acid/polyamine antiporter, APA family
LPITIVAIARSGYDEEIMSFITQIRRLFHTKRPETSMRGETGLTRCLNAVDLTMLGVGAIIGAGIFVLTGIAAATQAGPAVIFSYLLAGLACGFSAFAYAELASSVGGCGSAYGYAYASLGEVIAWIIGWDLLLEYGMDGATVSIGWSGYVQDALHAIGINLPAMLLSDPFNGGIINLPAVLIIVVIATVLSVGMEQSARFNKIMVFVKMSVIALFIFIGIFTFNPQNWHPFMPFGMQGIVNGAGLIFFAYIGFDAVSTATEEAIQPQRNIPIGIIASLIICTIIYVIFSGLLTGMMYYTDLNVTSPVALALIHAGHRIAAEVISLGAIAGLTTVILVMLYGASRVFLAMARDGLLPKFFVKIHPQSHTPRRLIWSLAAITSAIAGLLPINQVASLVNMGTLAAFVVVCLGVVVLRYTRPDMPRPFRSPGSPVVPLLGVALCLYLMWSLPAITWWSFGIWTLVGIVIYFSYSCRNSFSGKEFMASVSNAVMPD